MVYIAPLPKSTGRRARVADSQQRNDDRHLDHQQQTQQQRQRPRANASIKSIGPAKARTSKQKHVPNSEPDPQQLLAYQAAMATQVLQREQTALHHLQLQDSTSSSQQTGCQQQMLQPSKQSHKQHKVLPSGSRPSQHTASPSKAVVHSGNSQAAAATRQHVQAVVQQQAHCSHQQQQMRQVSQMQQPLQQQALQHQQQHLNKNHMFWDVAPRAINPSQVPGLTDGPVAPQQSPALTSSTAATQHPQEQPWQQKHLQQDPQWQQQQQKQQQNLSTGGGAAADGSRCYGRGDTREHGVALVAAGGGGTAMSPASDANWGLKQQSQHQHGQAQQQLDASAAAAPPEWPQAAATAQQIVSRNCSLQQQQQQHDLPHAADRAAELSEALKAAEKLTNPDARCRAVKEAKQQLYKLELKQQIAEREAARRTSKVAAAAKEAAEAAARAAAPPPWDPAAKLGRRGGGGEPLRGVDGSTITDLRNQRDMLPVPGLNACSSQHFGSTAGADDHAQQPQQQQYVNSSPAVTSTTGQVTPATAAAANRTRSASGAAPLPVPSDSSSSSPARPAAASGGSKGFMGRMAELRAGPSQEQREAAAAARLQLQRDLEAQVAEKAARAAAAAAAEAARAAAEEAALQHYLLNKSSSQADVAMVGKEASVVYAAAGPLNLPIVQPPAVPVAGAATSNASGSERWAQQKGRSKRVIDAPWLDQLRSSQQHCQQATSLHNQEVQLQLQQQASQLQLQAQYHMPQQRSQQHSGQVHCAGQGSSQHAAELGQETSSFRLGPAGGRRSAEEHGSWPVHNSRSAVDQSSSMGTAALAPLPSVSHSLSSPQLTAALQQVQQLQREQLRMWEDFKRQAQELQQLLADKQAVATDRDAARAELNRMQELLQQQKQLQDAYASQQQALLKLQQQEQQQSLPQQQQLVYAEQQWDSQDCLDAFVVETQMVPISMNNIPGGVADTQAVSDVSLHRQQSFEAPEHAQLTPRHAAAAGRNHKSRYSSFYGLEAELSGVSVASHVHSSKEGRKATRTRVSGGFKPGLAAAAAAEHASIHSSLAASTSFMPFVRSSEDSQQQSVVPHDAAGAQQGMNMSRATRKPINTAGATAVAAAAAAAVVLGGSAVPEGLGGAGIGRSDKRSSPVKAGSSPSKGRKFVVA